jgi:hypothetical protein
MVVQTMKSLKSLRFEEFEKKKGRRKEAKMGME